MFISDLPPSSFKALTDFTLQAGAVGSDMHDV